MAAKTKAQLLHANGVCSLARQGEVGCAGLFPEKAKAVFASSGRPARQEAVSGTACQQCPRGGPPAPLQIPAGHLHTGSVAKRFSLPSLPDTAPWLRIFHTVTGLVLSFRSSDPGHLGILSAVQSIIPTPVPSSWQNSPWRAGRPRPRQALRRERRHRPVSSSSSTPCQPRSSEYGTPRSPGQSWSRNCATCGRLETGTRRADTIV